MNQLIVKSFVAQGPIADKRYVMPGDKDGTVLQATGSTSALLGVADVPNGAKTGDKVDVVLLGWTAVEYGGTLTRGSLLTSDSVGRAIAATPAAGVNARIAGMALYSGVSGDVMDHLLSQSQAQG